MKKVGNINNIPIIQGRNNEIKNQIKAEINIDGTLSFKKRNSLGELTPLTYIDVQGNNAKSRRKVGELFNKPLISSPTHLLKKKEILVQKSNEGIILGIKVNNDIKIISKNDFFTITALASGDIQISIPGNVILQSQDGKEFIPFKSISYSKDLINWKTEYPKSTIRGKEFDGYRTINIPVNKGDKVYLKGDALCWYTNCNGTSATGANNNLHIASTAKFSISGNILSLFYEDNFKNYNTFPKIPSGEYGSYSPQHFSYIFFGSKFLYDAQELKLPNDATESCYCNTFKGCASLTIAPILPATTLSDNCYYGMFYNCSSLVSAPELPATTMKNNCYAHMFTNCSSLTKAPSILPATDLQYGCYQHMFDGCSSLTKAPELPATILTTMCYSNIFVGCTQLNYIKALFTMADGEFIGNWLNGVSPTGTFVKNASATWTKEQAGIPTGWTVQVEGGEIPEPEKDYLCFTSTGNSTVAMQQNGTPSASANKVIQYKLNDGQWQTWDLSSVSLSDGDKMYVKSDDEIPTGESDGFDEIYKHFVMTGSIAASGNIMSLLNFSTTLPDTDYAFCSLFKHCTSLTQAPSLPATTLAPRCYYSMFNGCTSLTQAPELPATTLERNCYAFMFTNCSKLNYVKAMFITNQNIGPYLQQWLDYVSSTGTFVKSKDATWSNTDANIPSGWTVETV